MVRNYPPGWTYADFAPQFKAELFNATQWAELFVKAGAKYVVLTSKHHEGCTLWPSSTSFNWNSKDVGPGKDLVGELSTAVRAEGLHFGVYHSMMDWYHPLYLQDKRNQWTTQYFVKAKCTNELHELVANYQPDILWSDGEWEAPAEYWNSTNFLAWLYNDSPVRDKILVNDRWGMGVHCKHGDFYNCGDRLNPGKLQPHKWENCMTMDQRSWGYRRDMTYEDVLSIDVLLKTLAETISCDGNLLINVGPRADGTIDAIFQERLLQLGEWLDLNGAAIYDSRPWMTQQDPNDHRVWYTTDGTNVYAIVTLYKLDVQIRLGALNSSSLNADSVVTILGYELPLQFTTDALGVTIRLPATGLPQQIKYAPVVKITLE
ncbi:alpha-L-fucosidase-like [Tropilaelaps mercedesae]|uniref:Putative alpha-L-fucosidase n=1 Tax=Tropilaelaps mercedesae TaxID=418985 RepID=A0A1V9X553_9ACAR|nr:alpha-L-fucosidase-like [Tropilaelaps mercedesae]